MEDLGSFQKTSSKIRHMRSVQIDLYNSYTWMPWYVLGILEKIPVLNSPAFGSIPNRQELVSRNEIFPDSTLTGWFRVIPIISYEHPKEPIVIGKLPKKHICFRYCIVYLSTFTIKKHEAIQCRYIVFSFFACTHFVWIQLVREPFQKPVRSPKRPRTHGEIHPAECVSWSPWHCAWLPRRCLLKW